MGLAAAPLRKIARDPEGLVQAASSMLYLLARFSQKYWSLGLENQSWRYRLLPPTTRVSYSAALSLLCSSEGRGEGSFFQLFSAWAWMAPFAPE